MPLAFVLDENLRGPLWRAIQRRNARGGHVLDAVRVGDSPELELGAADGDVLRWAEKEARILVSQDQRTLGAHLVEHLRAGGHSPGIFMIRPRSRLSEVVDFLVLAAHAGDPAEWRDRIEYIP